MSAGHSRRRSRRKAGVGPDFPGCLAVLLATAGCAAASPAPATEPLEPGVLDGGSIGDRSSPHDVEGSSDAASSDDRVGSGVTPAADAAEPLSACNEQPPQDFLIRSTYLATPGGNARAIQYRTDHYGYYRGFGRSRPHAKPPTAFAVDTTFMGLPVRIHRKVVPALACVELAIRASCADTPYVPRSLAGIRLRNTYRKGEVTNHAYGIAVDVDPSVNPCCGCVEPWSRDPRCTAPAATEYEHMVMPECWVHAFERFGFYWLGHDRLRDTMHFEFLGDPDRIVRSAASASMRDGSAISGDEESP